MRFGPSSSPSASPSPEWATPMADACASPEAEPSLDAGVQCPTRPLQSGSWRPRIGPRLIRGPERSHGRGGHSASEGSPVGKSASIHHLIRNRRSFGASNHSQRGQEGHLGTGTPSIPSKDRVSRAKQSITREEPAAARKVACRKCDEQREMYWRQAEDVQGKSPGRGSAE